MKRSKIDIKRIIKKKIELRSDDQFYYKKTNRKMNERDSARIFGSSLRKASKIKLKKYTGLSNSNNINNNIDVSVYPIEQYKKIFSEEIKIITNINVLFLISNYEREDMLNQLLQEIKEFKDINILVDYIIFDDVSSYKINDPNVIINNKHRGKSEYWKTFDEMFKYCKNNYYNIYVFTPNDFLKYDFMSVIKYGIKLLKHKYIFNIINDGRDICWNNVKPINLIENIRLQFFSDCGFITNYETLKALEFKINPVSNRTWAFDKNIGSQVGSQITERINNLKIPIFNPVKSFAFHGVHDSLMNNIMRKKNKLISK